MGCWLRLSLHAVTLVVRGILYLWVVLLPIDAPGLVAALPWAQPTSFRARVPRWALPLTVNIGAEMSACLLLTLKVSGARIIAVFQ